MQSHVVRAPLAKMMGFLQLIATNNNSILNKELLEYILDAGKEMDDVIREIVKKSERINS